MYVEKVKMKKVMFDGLFIWQHVSTSIFFLKTKVFYQNHFRMKNDFDKIFDSIGSLHQGL